MTLTLDTWLVVIEIVRLGKTFSGVRDDFLDGGFALVLLCWEE